MLPRAKRLLDHFKRALAWWEPSDAISFQEWLSQHTHHPEVHNLLQGFCAAFIGVSLNEVPAGEYFRFLKAMGRNNRYGIAVNGNLELMESLAGSIVNRGSSVTTNTACKGILVEEGRVRGARVEVAGVEETIEADFVISNAGPKRTIDLAGENELRQELPRPSPEASLRNAGVSRVHLLRGTAPSVSGDHQFR